MRKIFFSYYFLSYFALGTLMPLLPVYLNENLGMEQNMIGYILVIKLKHIRRYCFLLFQYQLLLGFY